MDGLGRSSPKCFVFLGPFGHTSWPVWAAGGEGRGAAADRHGGVAAAAMDVAAAAREWMNHERVTCCLIYL